MKLTLEIDVDPADFARFKAAHQYPYTVFGSFDAQLSEVPGPDGEEPLTVNVTAWRPGSDLERVRERLIWMRENIRFKREWRRETGHVDDYGNDYVDAREWGMLDALMEAWLEVNNVEHGEFTARARAMMDAPRRKTRDASN
jgi:hypothetical protein